MNNPNYSAKEQIKIFLSNNSGYFTEKEISDNLKLSLTKVHKLLKILVSDRKIFMEISNKIHPKRFPTKIYFIHKP